MLPRQFSWATLILACFGTVPREPVWWYRFSHIKYPTLSYRMNPRPNPNGIIKSSNFAKGGLIFFSPLFYSQCPSSSYSSPILQVFHHQRGRIPKLIDRWPKILICVFLFSHDNNFFCYIPMKNKGISRICQAVGTKQLGTSLFSNNFSSRILRFLFFENEDKRIFPRVLYER